MVTGSTGFIGSRLISLLSSRGYTVTGSSRKKLQNSKNVKLFPKLGMSDRMLCSAAISNLSLYLVNF
ncbi:MAG: NAD-dependent epimerase/dehydratase family protein [Nitrosopumilus sp.]